MLGVALLAGFLFIGGGAAIYLSSPGATATPTAIGDAGSPSPTLPPFVQDTPTPSPTAVPTPTFTFDFGSPSPSDFPSGSPSFDLTPSPTSTDIATATPTAGAPVAKFSATQKAGTLKILFTDNTIGTVTSWSWDFGDGQSGSDRNPKHLYAAPGVYDVVMTVSGPGGTDFKHHSVTVTPLATPTPTAKPTSTPAPTANPSPTPDLTPSPTAAPTAEPTVASPAAPPKAAISCGLPVGMTITCSANGSTGVQPLTYAWTWTGLGEGQRTGKTATWTYKDGGTTYQVTVTVTDGTGAHVDKSTNVTVPAP